MAANEGRFSARPALTVAGAIVDALDWPRSRPARIVAGDRAARIARVVLCADEAALIALEEPEDTAAVLATPPTGSDGRLGRRIDDPVAGSPDDVASWRRARRVVLDAALPLAGGAGGVDELVAERIDVVPLPGMQAPAVMRTVTRDVSKFVGYVPSDAIETVRDAIFAAGAGSIGDYDRCSWAVVGTGTFRGGDGTNPAVGTRGEFERVEEVRIEAVVPTRLVNVVCRAFVAAHPYEEPAFDVLPLALPASVGFGRVGVLGPGGGSAAWNALGAIDPELAAFGRPDQVAAGSRVVVHTGPMRDILAVLLDEEAPALLVVGAASDDELAVCEERGTAVFILDRTRAFEAVATDLAGRLSRAMTMPVTVAGTLHFPVEDSAAAAAPTALGAQTSLDATAAAHADYANGTWRLHFDGGSRGNPGPAAYGWVLYDPAGVEHEADGVRIGSTTNNVAEWTGLLRGVEHASQRGIRSLAIRGDSELVVKQATGVYRVKNAQLKPLADQVAAALRAFDRIDIQHVYRADNARADEVANEAMDGLR